MAIIQKRADELKPGDVINMTAPGEYAQRLIVLRQQPRASGAGLAFIVFALGCGVTLSVTLGALSCRAFSPEQVLDVESLELTPAQQHAEELAKRLWAIVDDIDKGNFADLNAARALLGKIKPPEPPTLAEALEILADVIVPNSAITAAERNDRIRQADALLDRARRAGVLK